MIYLDEPSLDYIPSTRGIDVQNFELAMGRYLGVDKCVAVNSGTSALFLALKACGIGKGDKVLVPATTFIATANAVSYTGAKVVFSDVDSKYWCMDGVSVSKRIKAVVPVVLYGNYYMSLNCRKGQYFILDCAEGLEKFSGRRDIHYNCFSFNGNKNITTGGGGLIIAKSSAKTDEIRQMINPGHYNGIGYNYGMTALSARLGLEQLELLDSHKTKKKRFNQIYRENLKHRLTFQKVTGTPWMTAVLFPKGSDITGLQHRLQDRGVPTRRVFEPLNHFKPYKDGKTYPVAEDIWGRGLCLPSSVRNSEEDIYKVCQIIKGFL
jgi:perosamine synthetase